MPFGIELNIFIINISLVCYGDIFIYFYSLFFSTDLLASNFSQENVSQRNNYAANLLNRFCNRGNVSTQIEKSVFM